MNQRADVSCCSAPFCEAHPLVAPGRPGRMLMESDMGGVNHEPFHVGFVDARIQQPLPDARVAPADEAALRVAPAAVFRRQIAPRRASSHNPENCVDEFPVVLGDFSQSVSLFRKERFGFCSPFHP